MSDEVDFSEVIELVAEAIEERRADPYRHAAARLYRVEHDQVTDEQRHAVKVASLHAMYTRRDAL